MVGISSYYITKYDQILFEKLLEILKKVLTMESYGGILFSENKRIRGERNATIQ